MTSKGRNWLLAISIVLFPFTLFSFFFFSNVLNSSPSPPALPNPNGYDGLLTAGRMMAEDIPDYDKMSHDDLRKAVSIKATALSLARAGLSNQCRVPVQYTESYISNHLDDLAGIKRLARAFTAEGMLAEKEGRTNEAVKSYMDTIRLGDETMRGGVLIDGLVGIAIESLGTSHLTNLVDRLDTKSCRETGAVLEALDSQRPTWDEIMQQERAWSQRTFHGWRYLLMRLEAGKSVDAAIAKSRSHFDAQEQKTRLLIIALAARAYELEKGKPPAGAADLVAGLSQGYSARPGHWQKSGLNRRFRHN